MYKPPEGSTFDSKHLAEVENSDVIIKRTVISIYIEIFPTFTGVKISKNNVTKTSVYQIYKIQCILCLHMTSFFHCLHYI